MLSRSTKFLYRLFDNNEQEERGNYTTDFQQHQQDVDVGEDGIGGEGGSPEHQPERNELVAIIKDQIESPVHDLLHSVLCPAAEGIQQVGKRCRHKLNSAS
jgi:hypothetical protein